MTDAILLEASLFQLKAATGAVDDDMFKAQLSLSMNVLSNAVAAASQSLNPATVNDVEFALNDVVATVGELNAADAEAVRPAIELMQADVAALKAATSLPAALVESVRKFQTKLRARRTAIERQGYRAEGAPEEPLPHPPAELAAEAAPLRQALIEAGFSTPAIDDLIADPSELRLHSIGDIVDELDVIIGS